LGVEQVAAASARHASVVRRLAGEECRENRFSGGAPHPNQGRTHGFGLLSGRLRMGSAWKPVSAPDFTCAAREAGVERPRAALLNPPFKPLLERK